MHLGKCFRNIHLEIIPIFVPMLKQDDYFLSFSLATVTVSGDSTFTPLDRETVDSYTLTVTVTDGDASHTSSHDFDVVVVDVNDQIPNIEKDTYIVSTPLPEDSVDGMLFIIYLTILFYDLIHFLLRVCNYHQLWFPIPGFLD